MCNVDFRPELAAGETPPRRDSVPQKINDDLLNEMAALNAHERLRMNSAPWNPDGHGDYISLT